MQFDFDVAVIGAGTAGLVSAVVADSLGAKVALIERDKVGGECLWRGCVPSKTLLRSAKVWEMVKRSEEFGVHVEKPKLVWSAIRLRLADVRDEIRKGERDELAKSGVTQISGDAKFLDGHTLELTSKGETKQITARKFILATGSSPVVPEVEGLKELGFLTYDGLFERPNLPKSLIFIGGGPLACEMAQAFGRFGTRVVVLQKAAQLMPHEDAAVAEHLLRILRAEGVEVHLNAEITRVEEAGARKKVIFSVDGVEQSAEAGEIVLAAGKQPRFDGMGLNVAGVQFTEKGVVVDEKLQTSARHIWACGDCTGEHLFTHAAEHAAKIAGANAVLPVGLKVDWKTLNWVTFTDPEIAHIGASPEEARAEWGEIETHRANFKTLDRAIIEGEASGFALIFTTKSGRIVGAQIIGSGAGELAPVVVAAVRDGALLQEWAETIFAYPTMSEIFHKAGNAAYQVQLDTPLVKTGLGLWHRIEQKFS
ncbi:NAD(P)/FAD-dependent oxidoreductase [bacterium]|nr:MAG: NAD(P)/FAD-dependent oxidoreductase [bacterium]